MLNYEIGMLGYSKAGHDKGKLYVITGIKGDRLLLSDGINKTLEKPKIKKMIHVQIKNEIPSILLEKIKEGHIINNEDIKGVIGG